MKTLPPGTFAITSRPIMQFDDMREAQDFIAQADARDPLGLGTPLRLVLGDIDGDGEHPQFLVATDADAERLVRAGYEYADSVPIDDGYQSLTL